MRRDKIQYPGNAQSLQIQSSGSSHHHRGQTDVTVNLQDGNLLEGSEAMMEGVCLHPIGHEPEGMILTADGQLKAQENPIQNLVTGNLPNLP